MESEAGLKCRGAARCAFSARKGVPVALCTDHAKRRMPRMWRHTARCLLALAALACLVAACDDKPRPPGAPVPKAAVPQGG